MLASSRMLSTSPYAAALPAPAAPTMMRALASSVAGSGTSAKPIANVCAIVSPNTVSAASAHTIAITTASAATVSIAVASAVAVPSVESGAVAVGSCTVLGIVAHAVAVFIHKRAAALSGPVVGSLRGPCRTAAQRIACAFQPCGTRASPRAICLGIICRASLRIQARGRDDRCGAGTRAHSLTGGHGTGCSHRNCGSKGHCSYQGNCNHAHAVILMRSFHLAPLSACLGRRLVLRGAFVPFTLDTIRGSVSLHVILNIFDQPRKNEGNPKPWRSLQAKKRAHSRNEPAPPRPRAPTPQPKDRGADRFLVSQTSARESS